jgi:hypothetical protein
MGISKNCAAIGRSLDPECKAFMCKINSKGNFEGNGEIFMDRMLYLRPIVEELGSDSHNTCRNGRGSRG